MCTGWSRHAAGLVLSFILAWSGLAGCYVNPSALVPSVEASPPPSPTSVLATQRSTQDLILRGQALFYGHDPRIGSVACHSCHPSEPGAHDGVGPNLAGIAIRGETRMTGLTAAAYIERSIQVHDEYLVPGFTGGLVRTLVGDEFGALLTDEELTALVAYLLTMTDPGDAPGAAAGGAPGSEKAPVPTEGWRSSVMGTQTVETPRSTPIATNTVVTPGSTAAATHTVVTPSSTTSATHTVVTPSSTATVFVTLTPTITDGSPTATGGPAPTPVAPTATALPAPTPAPLNTPVALPAPTLPSLPDEANLERYSGCVTCHALHPLQVQMPHPLNPSCNTCHRGSPNQIGCLSCHSTHGIDNKHEPSPDIACASCHK